MLKEFTRRFTTKYCLLRRIKFDSSEEKTAGSYWKACEECEGKGPQVLGIILTTIAGIRKVPESTEHIWKVLKMSKYSWEQKQGGICKSYNSKPNIKRNNKRKIVQRHWNIFRFDVAAEVYDVVGHLRAGRCAARRSWLCRRRRDRCGRSGGCWRTARTRRPAHCSSSEIGNNYTIRSSVCDTPCHHVILLCHLVIIMSCHPGIIHFQTNTNM